MKTTWMTITNKADKVVEIDIEGYIGSQPWDDEVTVKNTKEAMKKELKRIADIKADTIIVNINSPGGDVSHGISIHDLLAQSKAKVITDLRGMSASAATLIWQAGNTRRMSDNALPLIHNASTFAWGNKFDIKQMADDLEKIDERILNIYLKRAKTDESKLKKLFDENNGHGRWMSPEEALEYGLVDEVYEPMQAVASVAVYPQYFNLLPPLPKDFNIEKIPTQKKGDEKPMDPKEILKQMTDMFGVEFANKAFLAGKSLEDCKTEFIDEQKKAIISLTAENAALMAAQSAFEKENAALKTEIVNLKKGADPVPPSKSGGEPPPPTPDETFEDKVKVFEKSGLSKAKAMAQAVKEFPELHKKFIENANKGKTVDFSYRD